MPFYRFVRQKFITPSSLKAHSGIPLDYANVRVRWDEAILTDKRTCIILLGSFPAENRLEVFKRLTSLLAKYNAASKVGFFLVGHFEFCTYDELMSNIADRSTNSDPPEILWIHKGNVLHTAAIDKTDLSIIEQNTTELIKLAST